MGILLVYDVTDEASFSNVRNWMKNIEQHASDTVVKVCRCRCRPRCCCCCCSCIRLYYLHHGLIMSDLWSGTQPLHQGRRRGGAGADWCGLQAMGCAE